MAPSSLLLVRTVESAGIISAKGSPLKSPAFQHVGLPRVMIYFRKSHGWEYKDAQKKHLSTCLFTNINDIFLEILWLGVQGCTLDHVPLSLPLKPP